MFTFRRAVWIGLLGAAYAQSTGDAQAQAGKNGTLTVNGSNTVINSYTALTANAAAGNNTVSVSSTTGLSVGDLVLIIQMQGAQINNSNTSAYGVITNLRGAGLHELAVVQDLTATTLRLSQPLGNAYTVADKAQVVRVPRYTNATIGAAGTITGQAWNGNTGGIVAIEAQGTITVNGSITATGQGFRGGAFADNGISNNANYLGTGNTGGEKGEGIAGYGSSYPGGSRGRGAAANGGGGGNSVNAGGGGGANGGDPAGWTGTGRPSVATAAWAAAWNLEAVGMASSSSTGGGRGGYGVSDVNLDALSVGPDQAAWGDYRRPNTGGMGGRPLDYSTGRLFLGGGGGSGDGNTNVAGVGGQGGGLIYLIAPTITGSGTIVANGNAGTTSFANNPFADGAGGGGAGGTIVLAAGSVSNVRVQANGGNGGNTENTVDKAYGPGGGGGAGYIGVSSTATVSGATFSLSGGSSGVSTSPGMTEFPPNGATDGGVNTFALRTVAPVPLPVSWVHFGATWAAGRTKLAWATAQEKNNAYFQLERSLDGRTYAAFGERVPGAGNSTTARRYQAYDAQPPRGTVYYRVRQVDTDGQSATTAAVAVQSGGLDGLAYPNPVRRGQVLHVPAPNGAVLLLTDVLGRTQRATVRAASIGETGLDTQLLTPGQYWLRVPGGKAQRVVVTAE